MKRLNLSIAALWLIIALSFMMAGCIAATGTGTGESLVLKTSVQYGSIKYLSKNPGHIDKAEMLVDEIAAALQEDVLVTLDRLEVIVIESIPWADLAPENRLLLSALLTEIKYQVGVKIGQGVLDEADRVWGLEFLAWVRSAIAMARV